MGRREIARETVSILESGAYRRPDGHTVAIGATLALACRRTVLYRPEEYTALLAQIADLPSQASTTLAVTRKTTLAAARDLIRNHTTVACLNFASAKNPGGGFLNGAAAQEESLARASGLYAVLNTQPEFYAYHRRHETALYSNHVIFSPAVPVFRDDGDRLIDQPWYTGFITAAAVNAGVVRQNERDVAADIEPVMESRTRMVLAVAAANQCAALVLGAWGCGVFRNDPAMIAGIFARVLAEPPFQRRFRHIEFAIYDRGRTGTNLAAFEQVFGAVRL
jgi:uncharacterized protein (TIGR02452 family)